MAKEKDAEKPATKAEADDAPKSPVEAALAAATMNAELEYKKADVTFAKLQRTIDGTLAAVQQAVDTASAELEEARRDKTKDLEEAKKATETTTGKLADAEVALEKAKNADNETQEKLKKVQADVDKAPTAAQAAEQKLNEAGDALTIATAQAAADRAKGEIELSQALEVRDDAIAQAKLNAERPT